MNENESYYLLMLIIILGLLFGFVIFESLCGRLAKSDTFRRSRRNGASSNFDSESCHLDCGGEDGDCDDGGGD